MLHDLRLLRPFVVLADERHFTRAAERLHIAQPALSQQIARLERQVGAQLFERSSRGVALTAAGEALLADVQPALHAIDRGVAAAQRTASGRGGILRVGFLSSLSAPAVPLIASAFRASTPDVELHLIERSMLEQLVELRGGRIDVALFSLTDDIAIDRTGLVIDVLAGGPNYAVLPDSHPRAGAREIAMAELRDEPFVMPSGTAEHGYRAGVTALARRHGFAVRAGPQADNVATMFGLVSSGFGVTVVGWTAALVPRPGLALVRVIDERIHVVAARRDDDASAAGDALVAAAREVLCDLVPRA